MSEVKPVFGGFPFFLGGGGRFLVLIIIGGCQSSGALMERYTPIAM